MVELTHHHAKQVMQRIFVQRREKCFLTEGHDGRYRKNLKVKGMVVSFLAKEVFKETMFLLFSAQTSRVAERLIIAIYEVTRQIA